MERKFPLPVLTLLHGNRTTAPSRDNEFKVGYSQEPAMERRGGPPAPSNSSCRAVDNFHLRRSSAVSRCRL